MKSISELLQRASISYTGIYSAQRFNPSFAVCVDPIWTDLNHYCQCPFAFSFRFGLSTSTPEQECVGCLFVINTRHQLLAGTETPYKWHFMENIHETA